MQKEERCFNIVHVQGPLQAPRGLQTQQLMFVCNSALSLTPFLLRDLERAKLAGLSLLAFPLEWSFSFLFFACRKSDPPAAQKTPGCISKKAPLPALVKNQFPSEILQEKHFSRGNCPCFLCPHPPSAYRTLNREPFLCFFAPSTLV